VKKQFRYFADLKGSRLGSTTPGSTNDRLLKKVLEKNGLDWRKDVSLIYIGASEIMLKSLQSGAIDGTALAPPASFVAEGYGFFPLYNFINDVGALQGGIVISSEFINSRRDLVKGFLAATLKGLGYFKSERTGTVKIMTKFMGLNADVANRIYDETVPSFVSRGIISSEFQDRVLEFERQIIGTDKTITRDKVFDFSLITNDGRTE
jgi:NitT/TauT family transport system substrate-binding protein